MGASCLSQKTVRRLEGYDIVNAALPVRHCTNLFIGVCDGRSVSCGKASQLPILIVKAVEPLRETKDLVPVPSPEHLIRFLSLFIIVQITKPYLVVFSLKWWHL